MGSEGLVKLASCIRVARSAVGLANEVVVDIIIQTCQVARELRVRPALILHNPRSHHSHSLTCTHCCILTSLVFGTAILTSFNILLFKIYTLWRCPCSTHASCYKYSCMPCKHLLHCGYFFVYCLSCKTASIIASLRQVRFSGVTLSRLS